MSATGIDTVVVGCRVRVLAIDPRITASLSADEARDIESMIGEMFEVVGVGAGVVFVEKSWDRGRGRIETHKIPLWSAHVHRIVDESGDA